MLIQGGRAGTTIHFPLDLVLFGWPGNGLLAGRMEKSTEIEGVIVEFYGVGNAVKVSAVDTVTFFEVSSSRRSTAPNKR
jgi:hypothetical protein